MGGTEAAGEPRGGLAEEQDEGDGTREREDSAKHKEKPKLGMPGDGLKFQQQGEGGEAEKDDEPEDAIEKGGGEAGGLARGGVAADVESAGSIAAESTEEEGVVEISDPRHDVSPVERKGEALGAKQEPPAPRVKRKGDAGDKCGEEDGAEVELTVEAGELAPIDTPDEPADEQSGERIACGPTGGGINGGEKSAHGNGGRQGTPDGGGRQWIMLRASGGLIPMGSPA